MSRDVARELSAFPIRFAEPVYFGPLPRRGQAGHLNSGTATIVDLGSGPIAVTCWHLLEGYRQRLGTGERLTFQVGNLKLDPLARIIAQDEELDLATIDLGDCDLHQMQRGKVVQGAVFAPLRWPPDILATGDFVAMGGFPGVWRDQPTEAEIKYDSFSLGATRVTSVHPDHFVCQFEREYWTGSSEEHRSISNLGGLSGSPAFIYRRLHADWVGICYEFSPAFDLMRFRPASLIGFSGKIRDSQPAG